MYDYNILRNIAEIEYSDIVDFTEYVGRKLRINLYDSTYIDIFYSVKSKIQRYSYHWEREEKDGRIYRHDNIPDGSWEHIYTFPKHFHFEKHENVKESYISDKPKKAIREFLEFARTMISEKT
ncbi:MAG: DUF6516 family protein [bacterium]|nr:DUF6516 family protein [bacterium]